MWIDCNPNMWDISCRIFEISRVISRTFSSNFEQGRNRIKPWKYLSKSTFGRFLPKSGFPNFKGFFECHFWRHFCNPLKSDFWGGLLAGFVKCRPIITAYFAGFVEFLKSSFIFDPIWGFACIMHRSSLPPVSVSFTHFFFRVAKLFNPDIVHPK